MNVVFKGMSETKYAQNEILERCYAEKLILLNRNQVCVCFCEKSSIIDLTYPREGGYSERKNPNTVQQSRYQMNCAS